jgi:hypothetical protein
MPAGSAAGGALPYELLLVCLEFSAGLLELVDGTDAQPDELFKNFSTCQGYLHAIFLLNAP